ncbi:hypothetical protein O181_064418 [Austropuccinia psidii MF-1]|uniref:Uncharacterized protein n=1 Tax=Austropuccinia psidii MF-1 TaxID=1389203 RepID=A0A9Q3EMY8_9BASI|nr:hypothetical protein [Austropuccinia psidii MF-1]
MSNKVRNAIGQCGAGCILDIHEDSFRGFLAPHFSVLWRTAHRPRAVAKTRNLAEQAAGSFRSLSWVAGAQLPPIGAVPPPPTLSISVSCFESIQRIVFAIGAFPWRQRPCWFLLRIPISILWTSSSASVPSSVQVKQPSRRSAITISGRTVHGPPPCPLMRPEGLPRSAHSDFQVLVLSY